MNLTPDFAINAMSGLSPQRNGTTDAADATRCPSSHPLLGRCGLAAGHGASDPIDLPHAVCISLSPPACRRWAGADDWDETPTPWGDLSARPLPWAGGYLAGRHAQCAADAHPGASRVLTRI